MYKTTKEENEILTRTGRGTPMGEFLRRYWWPIGISAHLKAKPTFIRVFGEDLVLFPRRHRQGRRDRRLLRAPARQLVSRRYRARRRALPLSRLALRHRAARSCRFPASRPTARSRKKTFACRPIPSKNWAD